MRPTDYLPARITLTVFVTLWTALLGLAYLRNFHIDTTPHASRLRARRSLPLKHIWPRDEPAFALIAEPAPYSCPPLPFGDIDAYLFSDLASAQRARQESPERWILLRTTDQRPIIGHGSPGAGAMSEDNVPFTRPTPISWANKPIELHGPGGHYAP